MPTFKIHFYGDDHPALTIEADTPDKAAKIAQAERPGLAVRKVKLDREQPGQRRSAR